MSEALVVPPEEVLDLDDYGLLREAFVLAMQIRYDIAESAYRGRERIEVLDLGDAYLLVLISDRYKVEAQAGFVPNGRFWEPVVKFRVYAQVINGVWTDIPCDNCWH